MVFIKNVTNCNTCKGGGNELNHNCVDCISGFKFLTDSINKKNCYKDCSNYYYFDENNNYFCTGNKECPEKFNKLIKERNKCIDKCENDNTFNYKYEFNNLCYTKCPSDTYSIENEYICYSGQPEGYYFDKNEKIFKKCFDSCKNCNGQGNELNNNCKECNTGFMFLDDSKYKTNCYKICQYYYYFDEAYNYYCTDNQECPNKYNKLINIY